ncbi:hypothetical protein RvY_16739-2 [Ramazzottius varieornatus]|uniref:Pyrroloquinoline quinone-dependent pyranose dehydrogenase beta-propeller domain-containing protein n=1 Tax=Ramazzottius varieornatus TaxID=947166 RepID=A0A1D1VZL2_RAMVA|nr:hypothetical protein RvY_16739-2 [Ramazzottius varieornatus]
MQLSLSIFRILCFPGVGLSQVSILPKIVQIDSPQTHSIDPMSLPLPLITNSAKHKSQEIRQPPDATLNVPKGFTVNIFASGDPPNVFQKPRQMILAPNGDIFLSDTDVDGKVYVLRDHEMDGVADERFTFASGLIKPYGLAFNNGFLYVATTHSVVRFPYQFGDTRASADPETVVPLTEDDEGHTTRDIKFSLDGSEFFVGVGSSGDVLAAVGSTGDSLVEGDPLRAAISVYNVSGTDRQTFASGIRNPASLAVNPVNGELWTTAAERNGFGEDLIPDYATSVKEGGFYGYPYSYIGKNPDPRFAHDRPDLVDQGIVPDVLFIAHSAPLGMTFYNGTMFPKEYQGDAFVALHGSSDRQELTGKWNISRRWRYCPGRNERETGYMVPEAWLGFNAVCFVFFSREQKKSAPLDNQTAG